MYTTPLMGFIDEHCVIFDGEEENKLEFTDIHEQFKSLVETLLSEFLAEVGIVPEAGGGLAVHVALGRSTSLKRRAASNVFA